MADENLHRIAAKFALADPDGVDVPALIPLFHTWIQRGDLLPGLTIDVADYSHVPDGPGVMLIGHEWDRALDLADGRPGVVSVGKRGLEGDVTARVTQVVADALRTAALLAGPDGAGPGGEVRTDEVEITVLDRLRAPNTPETLAAYGPSLAAALAPLNEGEPPELVPVGDARRPFRVRATLRAAGDPQELAARLAPAPVG
ncbi:MAG TPA: hypothetical protein VNT51_03990 [Miltoncostaeaceae bacterium]|nr:hypothetical protein [Miltoncostaeaceae bacterium]